jgi:hypothetical protein
LDTFLQEMQNKINKATTIKIDDACFGKGMLMGFF